jgi:hypothetical protein
MRCEFPPIRKEVIILRNRYRFFWPYCRHCGAPHHPWAFYGPPPGWWMERQPLEEEEEDLKEHIEMLKEEIAATEEQLKKLEKAK